MTANETGEWIFSDEYHAWQDEQALRAARRYDHHRPDPNDIMAIGWRLGLYSVVGHTQSAQASWPEPTRWHDLDGSFVSTMTS